MSGPKSVCLSPVTLDDLMSSGCEFPVKKRLARSTETSIHTAACTCDAGHYSPGDDAMYACPANSSAPVQEAAEEECVCSSGFCRDAT